MKSDKYKLNPEQQIVPLQQKYLGFLISKSRVSIANCQYHKIQTQERWGLT
jgi:hypothetical protein